MASAKVVKHTSAPEPAEVSSSHSAPDETFLWDLPNGDHLVVGKPLGVLKLKIREILGELRNDPEMVAMCTAFLSVRSVNGVPETIRNYNQFEAFMLRFGSDENLDKFLTKYNAFKDPAQSEWIQKIMAEALEQSDMPPKEYIDQKALEYQKEQLARLRD